MRQRKKQRKRNCLRRKKPASRHKLQFERCEPRHLLATVVEVGNLGSGISVSGEATGAGYVMFSEEVVHARFAETAQQQAEHFVAVRYRDDVWQYGNASGWTDFQSRESDVLVATVDFDADVVRGLEGTVQERTVRAIGGTESKKTRGIGGIEMGYLEGDLHFFANQRNGQTDTGDIGIVGSHFFKPITIDVGALNFGVAVADNATGTGFMMYSVESVHDRFRGIISRNNADHLIAVRPAAEYWELNNNRTWVPFKPLSTDRLVAQIDFSADTIAPISRGLQESIGDQELGGDLEFTANTWHGVENFGEFGIAGTYFQIWDTPIRERTESMRLLANALLKHESATQRFPLHAIYSVDGQPLLSWRVAILPYIGYRALFDEFHLDEPWDSPHNIGLLSKIPHIYAQPSIPGHTTNILAFVGGDTVLRTPRYESSRPLRGTRIGEITDAVSNTILFAEVDAQHAVDWTRPADIEYDSADPLNMIDSLSGVEFYVAMADGSVQTLPSSVDGQALHRLVTRNDGEFADPNVTDSFQSAVDNLAELTLAATNVESTTGRYPAHAIYSETGDPLLSWRVAILPYIGHRTLCEEFRHDESWDSPHNIGLLSKMPHVYAHPQVNGTMTNFLAITGESTAFPIGSEGLRLVDIVDGLSNTALFVEADADHAVEWTMPQDILFSRDNPLEGVTNIVDAGFHVGLADGSRLLLPRDIAPDRFASLALVSDEQASAAEFRRRIGRVPRAPLSQSGEATTKADMVPRAPQIQSAGSSRPVNQPLGGG